MLASKFFFLEDSFYFFVFFFFITCEISCSAEEIMASEQANATVNLTAVEDVALRVDDAAENPAVDANANAAPAG